MTFFSVLTSVSSEARIHIMSLFDMQHEKLGIYLDMAGSQYDSIIAFRPTGWTHQAGSLNQIQPKTVGPVTLYGIPYSEHSSFNELRTFVESITAKRILPTVNLASKKSRDMMNGHFKAWQRKATV